MLAFHQQSKFSRSNTAIGSWQDIPLAWGSNCALVLERPIEEYLDVLFDSTGSTIDCWFEVAFCVTNYLVPRIDPFTIAKDVAEGLSALDQPGTNRRQIHLPIASLLPAALPPGLVDD